jgi:SAM-dependent methyltransferase
LESGYNHPVPFQQGENVLNLDPLAIHDNGHVPQTGACPVCMSTNIVVRLEISQIPVFCNVLWPTREEAIRAPKGDLRLGFCGTCGHVFNVAFNPALIEYTQHYENSLHFSPRFRSYAESLAARLIERYDLHGKDIIEIGCGQGEFLSLLCHMGGNRGIGFDPSYVPELIPGDKATRITFIQDVYSERYANYEADFVCCRQVLEHIQSPRDFLMGVRHAIGNRFGTAVLFEVPNALFTLRDLGIWDLIYEHPSYYGASSLSRLFTSCGFDIQDLYETYAGQFLCVEAVPGKDLVGHTRDSWENLEEVVYHGATFADRYRNKVQEWQRYLEGAADADQRAVVWGSGSKGVTFVNILKAQDQIEYMVDINPRKQGMYVPGTGQRIVPPQFLSDYQPDVVIIANPIYQTEIQKLVENLGLTTEFVSMLD